MTPGLAEVLRNGDYWIVVLLTLLIAGATIGLHYEALHQLNRRMPGWKLSKHPRILVMMFCLLGVHTAEIWLFGLGIFLALQVQGLGELVGTESGRVLDAVYASATTYTTLGYGDLVPKGAVRFLFGTEALIGLMMITWSASFTFFEMQRYWRN
jgi:hypothetical protein